LRDGRVVAAGPIRDVVADGPLSESFGLDLAVTWAGSRVSARRR
jgi:hypothetical protein